MGATQVVEPEVEEEAAPRPGSALLAVGIVTGIALVAALLVVAWARFGGGATEQEPPVIDAEPPEVLAGQTPLGQVPPEVAAVVEAPVVAAVRLEQLPPDLEGCGDDFAMEDARLESAIITPDAAVVAVVGSSDQFGFEARPVPLPAPVPPDAPAGAAAQLEPLPEETGDQVRASCAGSWDGGWTLTSANAGPVGEVVSSSGGTGLPDGTMLGLGTLLVPEGAAWLVHDRGGYRLAYPVTGLPTVTVTIPSQTAGLFGAGRGSTSALFLDDAGTVLEETFVSG